MIALRIATPDDFDAVFTRTKQLNAVEEIAIDDARLTAALERLLREPQLGGAWLVLADDVIVGHAVVTYGYDLEFGGHDAFLTELWIDEHARNGGVATAALSLLADELRARDITALHLGVRPDNPAVRLYERSGFERAPRIFMTKRL
jgi:ribosomal protein S18 acetylase RimI-like enzyme